MGVFYPLRSGAGVYSVLSEVLRRNVSSSQSEERQIFVEESGLTRHVLRDRDNERAAFFSSFVWIRFYLNIRDC